MKKMLTLAGVSVMALSLGTGVASAHEGGVTGPASSYNVDIRERLEKRLNNENEVEVESETEQRAVSGDAVVRFNTIGGDGGASTGDAENESFTGVEVVVENDTDLGGDVDFGSDGWDFGGVDITGPGSETSFDYRKSVDLRVVNENEVEVENETEQRAVSGDATVRFNTIGGGAHTGDARNVSETLTSVRIEN